MTKNEIMNLKEFVTLWKARAEEEREGGYLDSATASRNCAWELELRLNFIEKRGKK
jgi:hypothetical protein